MTARYRVLPSTMVSPARVALARTYSTVETAVDEMGTGVVVDAADGRLVAFHEQHLDIVTRRAAP